MQPFMVTVIAACFAAIAAAASYVPASNLSAPDPKYAVVDMSWVVESIPGNASSLIVLNGTVEEVYQQLNEANPDYTNLLDRYWASRPSMRSQDSMRSIESMDDRPDCGYCKVCNKRWESTGVGSVLDIINSVKRLNGHPNAPPGPGSCIRFGCSGGAQGWLCNDNAEELNLDSWNVISDAAEDLTRQCWWREKEGEHLHDATGGQIFQPGGWNVIIHGGDVC